MRTEDVLHPSLCRYCPFAYASHEGEGDCAKGAGWAECSGSKRAVVFNCKTGEIQAIVPLLRLYEGDKGDEFASIIAEIPYGDARVRTYCAPASDCVTCPESYDELLRDLEELRHMLWRLSF